MQVFRSVLLTVLVPALAFSAPVVLYVSPQGDDANPGTIEQPLATPQRARDLIREVRRKQDAFSGAVVEFRGGTYYWLESLALSEADSGTAAAPIVYRAYRDEKPILVGGRPVTGFVPYRDGILKADLAAQGFAKFRFRQLFLDGERQTMARYPNAMPDAPVCGGWAFVAGDPVPMYGHVPGEDLKTLQQKEEDVRAWANPTDGEVFIYPRYNWWNNIEAIAAVDRDAGTITLARNASFEMRPGDRYYVRGLLEELDAPGEWYLDHRTWTLYYKPPMDLAGRTVVVPTVDYMFNLNKASHIVIEGLTLQHCDKIPVNVWQGDGVTVRRCTIRHAAGYISATFSAVRISGTNCRVVGNDIYDMGSRGINLSGGDRETLAPGNSVAENNYIHHTGVFYKAGVGIRVEGVGNTARNNYIHDTPRGGLSWNGSDHLIELNHIRHTNREISDTAMINACNGSWVKRGTVIRYNYLHDSIGFGKNHEEKWVSPYYCWGIYLDNFTCGTTVFGNICVRNMNGGPYIHGGVDNVIENNIVIDGETRQMTYSSWKPKTPEHGEKIEAEFQKYSVLPAYAKYPGLAGMRDQTYEDRLKMSRNTFVRNILYYPNQETNVYTVRELDFATTISDWNVIWNGGKPLTIPRLADKTEDSWAAWRTLGFEEHSKIADPLFADPEDPARAHFRLKPESPALALGFKPIPFERIGCYASDDRASWPIVEAVGVREQPLRAELMPQPPEKLPRPRPTFSVKRRQKPITVDGKIDDEEWAWVNFQRGITLGESVHATPASPKSFAWLCWDDEALYVAIRNTVDGGKPLRTEPVWNTSDAVEVAIRVRGSHRESFPTFVLRGWPKGQFVSIDEAKAPADAAERLGKAATYGAYVAGPTAWSAEWRIPFAALDMEPKADAQLDLNLTCRKTANDLWLMWRGTEASSWRVDRAGIIVLKE
jgi:parallel beta-helix repeat protein